jgi:hypothetical protein
MDMKKLCLVLLVLSQYVTHAALLNQANWPINVKDRGAKGNTNTDDTASFTNALALAGDFYIPAGTYRISGVLTVPSNKIISGAGSGETVIIHDGDFRLFTVAGSSATNMATNVVIRNLRIISTNGGYNQTPIRFYFAKDCRAENIQVESPSLNGFEVSDCSRVVIEDYRIYSPGVFGAFFYNSEDCSDNKIYITNATSFSYELKNTKRHVSRKLLIDSPRDYGVYLWTGYDGVVTPGAKLCEQNTFYDTTVNGTTNSHTLFVVNGSPRNTFYNPIARHVAGGWNPFEFAGTSFYNEGSTITATATSGSTNLTSVSNGSAISAGDRIHIGNVSGNYTVYTNAGATISLTTAVSDSATDAEVGFVSSPDYCAVYNPKIYCDGSFGISISGLTADPVIATKVDGGTIYSPHTEGIHVANARGASIAKLTILDADDVAVAVDASSLSLNELCITNVAGAGIVLDNNSMVYSTATVIDKSGSSGISVHSGGGFINFVGGYINKCKDVAAIFQNDSALIGTTIKDTRYNSISYDGQVWIYGTNNVVDGCVFDVGESPWLDSHISEKPGATANAITIRNSMKGNLGSPIIYAAGSSSMNIYADGFVQIPNAEYFRSKNVAGSTNILVIGVDTNNVINIGPDGETTSVHGPFNAFSGAAVRADGTTIRIYPLTGTNATLLVFDDKAVGSTRGSIGFAENGTSDLTLNVNNGNLIHAATSTIITNPAVTSGLTISPSAGAVTISASTNLVLQHNNTNAIVIYGDTIEFYNSGIKVWSMANGLFAPWSNYDIGSTIKPVQGIYLQGLVGATLGTANIGAGTGTPEGSRIAVVGSLFMRTDGGAGTALYLKESGTGNTGWATIAGSSGGGDSWTNISGVLQPANLSLQPMVNQGWFIGTNAQAYWTSPLTLGESLIAARVVSAGDPNFNQFDFSVSDDLLASNYSSFGGYMSTNQINLHETITDANGTTGWQTLVTSNGGITVSKTAVVGGNTVASFDPTVADAPGNTAWIFGTENTLTSGAYLARFPNNGTDKFTIAHDGGFAASGQATLPSAIITNNIAGLQVAGNTNVVDVSVNAPSCVTNVITSAITYAHATNGENALLITKIVKLMVPSGGPYALSIPATWRTNVYSAVPPSLTNGTVTWMYVKNDGPTPDSASQTNCYVSFEFYR